MAINPTKLHLELAEAGLPVVDVEEDGTINYSEQLSQEEQTTADAIVAAHDPVDYATIWQDAAAGDFAADAPAWSGMSPGEMEQWIEDNVTDLGSAKVAMGKMALAIGYLADRVFPGRR